VAAYQLSEEGLLVRVALSDRRSLFIPDIRRMFMMRKLPLLCAFALIAAACGSPAEETAATATPTTTTATQATTTAAHTPTTLGVAKGFPVTVAGAETADRPVAIVSLSPTATETLFAIGAGEQVIAVDSLSNYPAEAPVTNLSAFEPNIEAIAALSPDLVVISWDPGEVVAGLNALGIPVINRTGAISFEDAYNQITELGAATGNVNAATELTVTMQAEIAALVDEYQAPETAFTFYHEVDNTFYSATSATFVGSIYSLFGLSNIADAADPGGRGFPQLSAEYILESDPDVIFYGCALWCGTSPETMAKRPGWAELSALETGSLVALDDDITSRWGPRLVEFVELIGETLTALVVADK